MGSRRLSSRPLLSSRRLSSRRLSRPPLSRCRLSSRPLLSSRRLSSRRLSRPPLSRCRLSSRPLLSSRRLSSRGRDMRGRLRQVVRLADEPGVALDTAGRPPLSVGVACDHSALLALAGRLALLPLAPVERRSIDPVPRVVGVEPDQTQPAVLIVQHVLREERVDGERVD